MTITRRDVKNVYKILVKKFPRIKGEKLLIHPNSDYWSEFTLFRQCQWIIHQHYPRINWRLTSRLVHHFLIKYSRDNRKGWNL